METGELIVHGVLVGANLLAGFGCAIPLAKMIAKLNSRSKRVFRYVAILLGIYIVESFAVCAGMATQVFTVGLAFVWGIVFGLWLRKRGPALRVLKASFFMALYSILPTASLLLIPVMMWIGGDNVLSAEAGARFGIPRALHLPWPLNTILGFFGAVVIGTAIFKTIITAGEVSLLIHLGEKSTVDSSQTENSPLDVERSKAT